MKNSRKNENNQQSVVHWKNGNNTRNENKW